MTDAYRLDRGSVAGDCRFTGQSEEKREAIELAEGDGQNHSDDERRTEHRQVV